ncbi:hypothetical protein V500_07799 [Pseudogymnoascus sp. VKM F-4518 (FW-2643)]|nr:hypothetical protein V500_07799 [Pseudogymnoascus sp. VKM F-4518 (FW-2643)]
MTSPYPSTSNRMRDERSANTGTISSATVRPRTRRLISTDGDEEAPSRDLSPLPAAHPSRTGGSESIRGRSNGGLLGGSIGEGNITERHGLGKGLFDGGWTGSWTALQGLASSVLGADTVASPVAKPVGATRRKRHNSFTPSPAISEWGPSGKPDKGKGRDIAAESLAARNSAVNILKTASAMQDHEGTNSGLQVGRHKRRTSDDFASSATDDDTDALVYVHHVKPSDTLAGVILKYNCDPTVFRKANRLWPNDVIQFRKTVLVPVDACAVRGVPCESPNDLITPAPTDEEPPNLSSPSAPSPWANSILSPPDAPEPDSPDPDADPWIPVRWVLLPNAPASEPTQIARLPRKKLGYFPRRRRKSGDVPSSVASLLDSPRVSVDVSASASPAASPGPRRLSNLTSGMAAGRAVSVGRPRRESTSEAAARGGWFRGPGGVGTFGPDVKRPGPAQDGLNRWVNRHVPGLTIDDVATKPGAGFADRDGVSAVGDAAGSGGRGIEVAAAAIEGWVRRLGRPVTPLGRQISREEVGDLIELRDGPGSDDGNASGFGIGTGGVSRGRKGAKGD